MARGTILSVLAFYNYDSTIFDGLTVPSGLTKSILVDKILAECAELEVIYSDPAVMKYMITNWSAANQNNWQHMMDVLEAADYDPFVNVNRTEATAESVSSDNTNKVSAYDESTFTDRENNQGNYIRNMVHTIKGDSAISDSQDLVRKEMELRLTYNIYDVITNSFKEAFCLLVY